MSRETIQINILYFAKLGEDLGCTAEQITVEKGSSLNTLIATLTKRNEKWKLIAAPQIRRALNQSLTRENPVLNDNDEIAFFPPVTGG